MARQIKRFLHSELKHVSKWTYVLILAIYACMVILQLNSFPMWFCSLREGSFLGFSQTRRLNCRQRTPFYLVMQRFFAACCSTWPRWLMHCSFRLSRLALSHALSVRALSRNRGGCRRLGEGSGRALPLRERCCLLSPYWARLSCQVSFCTVLTAQSFRMLSSIST